jgi:hypothetical protein
MDGHLQKHNRRPAGMDKITTTPKEPTSSEMNTLSLQHLLRCADARHLQERIVMSQKRPYLTNEAVKDTADAYVDNGVGRMVSRKHADETRQLVGQALEDRRRSARDRIRRSGWVSDTAEMAIRYVEQVAWKDTPSKMSCVQHFIRSAEELGEFCTDLKAIRCFLNKSIHKLITFHAMDKDFHVPHCIVRRANQTAADGDFKYLWFRLWIQEYQNLDKTPAAFWVEPYRAQGEEVTTGGFNSGPGRIHQGDTSVGRSATSPATTALSSSLGQNINIPRIETSQISVDHSDHMRKRKRAPDDVEELDTDVLTTEVKRESTEDVLGNDYDDGTASAHTEEAEDGEDKREARKRTLTVLFHGMRGDDAKESEHVQVYVPRTAKGVTINFL